MTLFPAKMGRLNKRALLGQLQKSGRTSRAALAKSLGLSQPTVGKIVDELLALGVLEEVESPLTGAAGGLAGKMPGLRPGRPGRLLQLDRVQPRFLGIQLGVTETRLAGLPAGIGGEDRWSGHFPTPQKHFHAAGQWLRQLKTGARQLCHKNLWGVLVSVPGIVDEPANRVVFSPNLRWIESADLPRLIRTIWNVPVLLVQEERALALGHQLADPQAGDFLLVDFGDGVGGAMIVQGKPYASPLPISGELGHTPVLGNRRPCGCGARGCVETLVSRRGLLASFAAAQPGKPRTWPMLVRHIHERGVTPWLAQALDAVATTIAGTMNVMGLRRVVITGSLTELPPAVVEYLSQAIRNGALWARFGKIECESAPRRRMTGLVAVGIDRLVIPICEPDEKIQPGRLP